uniref:Uncharacterized protein n=1 Tax=Rhizophora mucronata TaxID=61149 RepID=A0A2P2Q2H4_RHIMU
MSTKFVSFWSFLFLGNMRFCDLFMIWVLCF